ncbi:alpha/beta fold hydrolase [Dactylosporangium sp. CA-092794]|uniref:alpha/beta fold hydrolase n=1 Tax=Dactylosporangium sp. CA-092794 TaxID=3239929 RepID=UPI003D94994D
MSARYPGPAVAGVTHNTAAVNGTELHYVSAGDAGSPILLVHGFPESWWAFHKVIPLLAETHRVFAVDLRGFGDSSNAEGDYGSATAAEDLHQLIAHLGAGPVHLTGQDISGGAVFRLAATHPEDLLSFTAIEMGLAGFGLEGFADVTHGGSWHIGVLAAPGIPELLLAGREREFLGTWAFPAMTAVRGAITDEDVAEFARGYARPNGWRGAAGLYTSMLTEGDELKALAAAKPLRVPALAVGASGGPFTEMTVNQVAASPATSVRIDGAGHYVALETPEALADAILAFVGGIDDAETGRTATRRG